MDPIDDNRPISPTSDASIDFEFNDDNSIFPIEEEDEEEEEEEEEEMN